MKNVTVSMDDELLRKSREYAKSQGKSFNTLVREVLRRTVYDSTAAVSRAWIDADELKWKLDGPVPTREERNAR